MNERARRATREMRDFDDRDLEQLVSRQLGANVEELPALEQLLGSREDLHERRRASERQLGSRQLQERLLGDLDVFDAARRLHADGKAALGRWPHEEDTDRLLLQELLGLLAVDEGVDLEALPHVHVLYHNESKQTNKQTNT